MGVLDFARDLDKDPSCCFVNSEVASGLNLLSACEVRCDGVTVFLCAFAVCFRPVGLPYLPRVIPKIL